jgi:uncharacterized protein (TIGR01777 family)
MLERVLITGYNGALAQRLKLILEKEYELIYLTSNKKSVNNKDIFFWNIKQEFIDPRAVLNCDHIVHLCGYNIMNRWSTSGKAKMYSSRVDTANLLFKKCKELQVKIKTFVGASAMGYYGLNTIADVDEDSACGKDWLAKLSLDWEKAANNFTYLGSRVINLRISLLMDPDSGFLRVTLFPLRFGISSVFLPSNLSYSWMHIDDVSRFILFSIKNNNVSGPYNMASNSKQTQLELIKEIRNCVFKYAIIFPVPLFLMKIIMGGRSQLLKGGLHLKVDKLVQSGFKYKFPSVSSFLNKK